MNRYVCLTLSRGKKLAEVEAVDWFDAVGKFAKMGYFLYNTDIVKVEEGN
jgi:hypothetical protein